MPINVDIIEIVGTDTQTASRVIINANFRSLRDVVVNLDERLERLELITNEEDGTLVNKTFVGYPIINDLEQPFYGLQEGEPGSGYIPIDGLIEDGLFLENALDFIIIGVEQNYAFIQDIIETLNSEEEGSINFRLNTLEDSDELHKIASGYAQFIDEYPDFQIANEEGYVDDGTGSPAGISLYYLIEKLQEADIEMRGLIQDIEEVNSQQGLDIQANRDSIIFLEEENQNRINEIGTVNNRLDSAEFRLTAIEDENDAESNRIGSPQDAAVSPDITQFGNIEDLDPNNDDTLFNGNYPTIYSVLNHLLQESQFLRQEVESPIIRDTIAIVVNDTIEGNFIIAKANSTIFDLGQVFSEYFTSQHYDYREFYAGSDIAISVNGLEEPVHYFKDHIDDTEYKVDGLATRGIFQFVNNAGDLLSKADINSASFLQYKLNHPNAYDLRQGDIINVTFSVKNVKQ